SIANIGAVPDTFRNPGPQAPLVEITIANTGEAVLGLSNATVSNAPVWSIANPDPVDLPSGETYAYLVRFAPTEAGPAPSGMFSVATSDPATPTLATALHGTGLDRAVRIANTTIDMRFVGVDTTGRLSDGTRGTWLEVDSLDPDHAFTIQQIAITGG